MEEDHDLELLTRNQLIALSDSLGINHLDLLGHGSKRETWIRAIQGYREDQEFFKKWQQSQKDLPCSTTTTPEDN